MIRGLRYKEAQIHGELSFSKHVDRLCAADVHNSSYWPSHLKEICSKHGWKFSWISEEKFRMEEEEAWQRLGARFWKERLLLQLSSEELAAGVPKVATARDMQNSTGLKAGYSKGAKIEASVAASQGSESLAKTGRSTDAESKAKLQAAEAQEASRKKREAAKLAADAARAAAKAARAQAECAVKEAKGELELAWAMLLSQDAADAAALVANLIAARELREGDMSYLLMSVTALAEGTEQEAWSKLQTEFNTQVSVWESQALTGARRNYQGMADEMRGLIAMADDDPQSARFVLDDLMQKVYARKLHISAGVKDAVFAIHNCQELAQRRWELAARLESSATCHEKLSGREESELLSLVKACTLDARLEERTCKLLQSIPAL
eukprot:TRINITY_DN37483_c0_g1_i1.p1 TRINITY_DN37483_c0_g1~~TRINITY_DN37483_c0_g1_i1.p1  ORF type:complete len:420 (-),score=85.61 TRINITY_DN37483_c0_g1_i1:121-1263(-)